MRALAVALALSAIAATAFGAPAPSASSAPTAAASDRPLAPLPKVPGIDLPKPAQADLDELDALLGRLRSADPAVRDSAVRELLEIRPKLVAAIHARLAELADKADRDEMKKLLHGIRSKARADVRSQMRADGKRGKIKTPDYLDMVIGAEAEPKSKTWQDLVALLGMSRMLVQIGTVEAARELVNVYVRFGEFVRVDTQLQLEKLGDKAVAALIETRRHPAPKIAHWAARELDSLGKAIPSEAVQTSDFEVLADVLLAYGRTRDPDAARIVISFANTERAQVREAAREAVVMMGEVANWQLRDTYEDIVGKKPPRDWDWKRTARELFGEYDRQRLAQVYQLFDAGMAAYKAGDLDKMRDTFDKVLARSPLFEHRDEMVAGYVAYANKVADDKRDDAILALRRADRLAPDDNARKPIKSLLLVLDGEALLDKGVADQTFFRRAIELDASNTRAREDLARIERGETKRRSPTLRYAGAGAIAVVALLAIAFIALRRGRSAPEPPPSPEPSPDDNAPDNDDATHGDDAPDNDDATHGDDAPDNDDATHGDDAPNLDDGAPDNDKAPSLDDGAPDNDKAPSLDDGAPDNDMAPSLDDGAPDNDNAPSLDDGAPDNDMAPSPDGGAPDNDMAPSPDGGAPDNAGRLAPSDAPPGTGEALRPEGGEQAPRTAGHDAPTSQPGGEPGDKS